MPWLAWMSSNLIVISAMPCLVTASTATVLCFCGMALRSVISNLELSGVSWVLGNYIYIYIFFVVPYLWVEVVEVSVFESK